jgi:hypothetical protein
MGTCCQDLRKVFQRPFEEWKLQFNLVGIYIER